MKENEKCYMEYMQFASQFSSRPFPFASSFSLIDDTNQFQVDRRQANVQVFYSGKPIVKKVTTIGNVNIKLVFGEGCVVENVLFNCPTGDLTVFFAPYSEVKNVVVQSFDKNNVLHFGCGTTINNANFLVQGDSKSIFIGHDCMFSTSVFIRTSDSHSMFSYSSDQRVNSDASVTLGDHVWVGRSVSINKGTIVSDDAIIGQGSVVSGVLSASCCYAGVPAKKLKENVTWDRTRSANKNDVQSTLSYRPRQQWVNSFFRGLSVDGEPLVYDFLEKTDFYYKDKELRWLDYYTHSV